MVARALSRGILGVVLAGGRSSRFGTDKAEAMLQGMSLLDRVCESAGPQVEKLLVNRNDSGRPGKICRFECLPDEFPGEGPLAGVLAGLARARADGYAFLATFPCDAPFFPRNAVSLLHGGLAASGADISVAKHNGVEHYASALWRVSCAPVLSNAFAGGLRSIRGALNLFSTIAVEFPAEGDGPGGDTFFNINKAENIVRAEQWMSSQAVRPA